ncbi:thioredoxin family protein [Agromyces sp. SYSU K20354]|uniref:thioredoxin family protein n=1 Tax=Agromyces cavernae TaxID=2898659 RepID=UPI001E292E22|nr:thioredoxin family protein [Agromyces cavernae]MCD2442040.1 thioredoxin family protein [Agromyces cavernae]
MHARRRGAAALLASALALTGCATQPTDAAPPGSSDRISTPSATPEIPTPRADAEAGSSVAPLAPSEGAYLDYTDGAIESTAGPKVLFFHATWCPKCRQLDEELRTQGAPDGLTVFKVDYDNRTDLRQKYGVTLQTTVVFVDDRGELISRTVLYDDPSIASLVAAIP